MLSSSAVSVSGFNIQAYVGLDYSSANKVSIFKIKYENYFEDWTSVIPELDIMINNLAR